MGKEWNDEAVAAADWGDLLPQVERDGGAFKIIGGLPRDMVSIGPIQLRHLRIAGGEARTVSAIEANAVEVISQSASGPGGTA